MEHSMMLWHTNELTRNGGFHTLVGYGATSMVKSDYKCGWLMGLNLIEGVMWGFEKLVYGDGGGQLSYEPPLQENLCWKISNCMKFEQTKLLWHFDVIR